MTNTKASIRAAEKITRESKNFLKSDHIFREGFNAEIIDHEFAPKIKEAYMEGWSDGHRQGMDCGHDMSPRCRNKEELQEDWKWSDTKKGITNAT